MEPMTWIAIAMAVASLIISVALAPKPKDTPPSTFNDMNIPQVDEGTPQAVFFGTCWTEDWMVTWSGNFRTKKVKAKQGKK